MTRKIFLFEAAMILAVLFAAALVYPRLPAEIATHWGADLQPNGYSPKWAIFLIGPGVMAALSLFTYLGPWLSPQRFEVESFQSTYSLMLLLLFCMMAYCSAVMLWSATEHPIDAGRAIQGAVCVLFAALGNVMGKVRRNFFLGIKTPWALASERVWNPTHRLAAKTFFAVGVIGVGLTFFGVHAWPMYILLAGALVPAVYSLVFYKRLERAGELY